MPLYRRGGSIGGGLCYVSGYTENGAANEMGHRGPFQRNAVERRSLRWRRSGNGLLCDPISNKHRRSSSVTASTHTPHYR